MPSDQSAVSVLIQEVLSDPDLAHDDVFRRLLQAGLQDLIDAEATAAIGAGPYERSSARSNRRNGKRPKKLATTAGEVDLAIPKLRQGSFFPSLLCPRKRVDKALYAVICSAWIEGVSSPGFCGGWFIWCRWLPVVIVPGGGCRAPRRLRARRGFASRWRSVAGWCPYQVVDLAGRDPFDPG